MHGITARPQPRRPSRVPLASAVVFALVLGATALLAAIGLIGPDEAGVNTVGTVLRIVVGIAGGCCLVGAVPLVLRHPGGRTLTILGGTIALALPVLLVPMVVVVPADLALGLRQSGGLVVHLVLPALGLVTVIQGLRRETRDAVARRAG